MSTLFILFLIFINCKVCSAIFLIGSRVQDGQFPWLIQFKTIAPCGGVLISPDWVLTAAQCVQTDRQSILLQAVGLNGTGSLQVIRILHAYIYPEYKVHFHDHDHNIALMKLVEPFDLCDSKVRFMDIAPFRLDETYKSCLIFGWQSYVGPSTKVFAKPIQYSRVALNAWKYCIYMHKGNASLSNVFCTMVETDGDMKACAGNPGTPVVCEDQYQRMVLVGIASWTNFSLNCGGLPSYLSVGIFRSWIYELIIKVKKTEDSQKSRIRIADCNEPQGGTYTDSFPNNTELLQLNKRHYTGDISEILEKARKLNLILETENDSAQHIAEQSIISSTPINKTLLLDNVNDYTMIVSNDEILVGNIKEREENLQKYQEIGPHKNNMEEMGSSEIESPEDIDDLLPFTFEEFTFSNAFVNPFFSTYILMFYLLCLHIVCR